ncbi:ABC transporter permease [Dictyobacter arantiisoli]|uniref:Taurine ABC transporter permease n=1 Tax=Dictyobacter arantiisoli TaxID=2014874 RepID=A0A5A5THQ5_9CHLR|nr:ABC transporter permease [Dictyobacter arantiisoli]GCF10842.1 taurine ABC transporter permease [Dictyobacter arantiisoli]
MKLEDQPDSATELVSLKDVSQDVAHSIQKQQILVSQSKFRWDGQRGLQGVLLRFIPLITLLVALLLWQLVTALNLVSPIALPAPVAVWQSLIGLLTGGFAGQTLFADIWISFLRILAGFVAAVIIGIPVGILMARNVIIFRIIDPFLQFIRPVPPLAYIPLLVLWFGINELPKIILIMIGTLPIILISTVSGVRSTPVQRIRVAQCLGATPLQLFWHTILPSALPEIFTGMRIGIGIAWSCLVAAEFIAASAGLGFLVQYAGQQLQADIIFVGIIAIGLLGYAMELLIRGLERLVVPWKGHV